MTKPKHTNLTTLAQDYGLDITQNINESIWIDRDITFLSGDYCDGIRGLDHRVILSNESETFKQYHDKGFIRIVQETMTALVDSEQLLTVDQVILLNEYNYTIEKY